jgi:hypothetical protein
MSKINVKSPYYLDVQEPTPPQVELDCTLINLSGLLIDEFGNVTLPYNEYGDILSYDSTDVDFSNGKFDTVLTDTSRTITFRISIPSNFTNAANDYIDCDATAIQPTFVCTGGVTTNGTIPNQSLNTGGNTSTIDLSLYFTQGVAPISGYRVTNSYPNYVETSIYNNTLTISAKQIAGTITIFVEAFDDDIATCNATQPIQITLISLITYDCSDAYFYGGSIQQDGEFVFPSVNGGITAVKLTSGGSPIANVSANNTGNPISYTLYFDITVPTGYSNTGATVECSKSFIQPSSTLPDFTCEMASLTGQAVYLTGAILQGEANKGTITGFSPTSFTTVSSITQRTVNFNVLAPSGYSNSGSTIVCPQVLYQPAISVGCGNSVYYVANTFTSNMSQIKTIYDNTNYTVYLSGFKAFAQSSNFAGLIGNNLCYEFSGTKRTYNATQSGSFQFILFRKSDYNIRGALKTQVGADYDYYVGMRGSIVYEVWLYNYINNSFTKVA